MPTTTRNIREFCRAAFSDDGYRVLVAHDGIEALEIFVAEFPDLAVLDISMPRASGLEVLERIKGISPRTPVILYSAHEGDFEWDQRAQLASACVAKGDDFAELKRTVARTLRRCGPPRRNSSRRP